MKAAQLSALASGWFAERFARETRLRELGDYMRGPELPEDRAHKLAAMFDRMIEKQEVRHGAG